MSEPKRHLNPLGEIPDWLDDVHAQAGAKRDEYARRAANEFKAQLDDLKKGKGKPLGPILRSFFEEGFRCNLRSVRIHDDREADSLNRRLGGTAFAQGEDIFFRHGAFVPGTPWGLWLLAHELVHVQQQRGSCASRVAPGWAAALEREANVAGSAVLNGRRVLAPPRQECPSREKGISPISRRNNWTYPLFMRGQKSAP